MSRLDRGHGSPYDRGGADYWYRRPFRPHCFEGATYATKEIIELSPEEAAEYAAGWDRAERQGDQKDWG